jgi:hypothetical protein
LSQINLQLFTACRFRPHGRGDAGEVYAKFLLTSTPAS